MTEVQEPEDVNVLTAAEAQSVREVRELRLVALTTRFEQTGELVQVELHLEPTEDGAGENVTAILKPDLAAKLAVQLRRRVEQIRALEAREAQR